MIRCAFKLLPLSGTGTLSATQNLHSSHCLRQKGVLTGGRRQRSLGAKTNQVPLQHSIRHTQINPRFGLRPQGGRTKHPRARIAIRPKLARSCWFDTMMGKSLMKTGTEREMEQHREVCFWLVLSRRFPPAGASSRAAETHSHTLGKLLLVWCSSHTDLGPGEMSLPAVARNVTCWCEMLWARVKGHCLHRPENWLVRQLIGLWAKAGTRGRIY
jgi:hypothetical protein